MKIPLISTILTLMVATLAGTVLAEKADRDKPMNIEADALRYDDLAQTSVFTGRVLLTKGSIIIRGARLNVRQDPQGYQYGVVTSEPGKLAFFRQKREGLDEFIEGEGETIEYDGRADTVKFTRKAQLRRYKGPVVNDEMTGGVIVYDNTTDVFTIDNGATSGSPSPAGGRVRAMLTPTPSTSSTAPKAAAPAALKASPSMEGDKR